MSIEETKIANEQLQQMIDNHAVEITPASKPQNIVTHLKKIPFLSKYLKTAGDLGTGLSKFGGVVGAFKDPVDVTQGFQFGGISLAVVDFLLIPAIYLASYVLGQKVPINLNNNARWVYATVLLALSLTALFVPIAAPVIGFIAASLCLSLSVFLLGKSLYQRYELGKTRRALGKSLEEAEVEMDSIENEAKNLQNKLKEATADEDFVVLYHQIDELKTRYDSQKETLTLLKQKEAVIDQKIKKLGVLHIVDKSLVAAFSSLVVVGLVVSLFFPPVGLGILLGVSIASLAYCSVRLAAPLVIKGLNWIHKKLGETQPLVDLPDVDDSLSPNAPQIQSQAVDTPNILDQNTHSSSLPDVEDVLDASVAPLEPSPLPEEHYSTGSILEHLIGSKEGVIANLTDKRTAIEDFDNEESSPTTPPVLSGTLNVTEREKELKEESADDDDGDKGERKEEESKQLHPD